MVRFANMFDPIQKRGCILCFRAKDSFVKNFVRVIEDSGKIPIYELISDAVSETIR